MSFLDRFNRKLGEAQPEGAAGQAEPVAVHRQPADDKGHNLPGATLPGSPASAAAAKHEILLELGDFLPLIPPELVRPGPHPAEARLKFDMADLANRIDSGQTSIRLAEIRRQVPEIFLSAAPPSDDLEVRFPWEKVMRMLADARTTADLQPRAGVQPAVAEESPGSRRVPRNITPGASERAGAPPLAVLGPPFLTPLAPATPARPGGAAGHSGLLHDDKLTREEILRACDGLWAELARVKGEHERQLAALSAETGARVRQLTEERDALARQLAAPAGQSGEQPKPAVHGPPHPDAPPPASPAGMERSQKGHQRQVDELLRRIAALESHQREAAHELTRERESRIKLERQLGALDRLSREATMHHEATVAALKREFETAGRKRDAEAARALKEAQEQFEGVISAKARIAVELDQAHARLAKSPAAVDAWEGRALAQFEADLENYRNRIKQLLAERDALAGEKAVATAPRQEAGAAAEEALRAELAHELEAARKSSNATITNLRSENTKLTCERDLALKDGETLRAEYEPRAAAWTAERAALEGDLAAARQACAASDAALGELRDAREKLAAESAAQAAALAQMTAERDGLGAHLQALQAELKRTRQQQEITAAELRATEAGRQRDREAQAAGSEAARQEQAQALADLAGERDKALATLAEERGQARAGASALERKLSAEISRLTEALDAARQEGARAAQALAAANAEAGRKFAAAREEREALLAGRRILTAELDSAKEALAAAGRLREERHAHTPEQPAPETAPEAVQPAQPAPAPRPAVPEVHEAEVLPVPAEAMGPLKIARIRPVVVAPPQLQNH